MTFMHLLALKEEAICDSDKCATHEQVNYNVGWDVNDVLQNYAMAFALTDVPG